MQNDNQSQPTSPDSSQIQGQVFAQPTGQKPSKWRYFFIVLGILQALGVGLFVLIIMWAIRLAKGGASGTEFIGLIVFVTLVPAVALMAIVNIIGLPIYMWKHRPRGKELVFSILSLAVSIIVVLFSAYSFYQSRVGAAHAKQDLQRVQQKIQAQQQQFAADNAKPEITKDEAIQLLQLCQLKGFYYTNQTDKEGGNWGELSSTGVVLTKIEGQPFRISIADKLVAELVPIARAAQKTCGEPQFWHDGSYEQYQNGHWYFKGLAVN